MKNIIIVDSPDKIPYTNFRVNGTRQIQEARFFRSASPRFYDRGNVVNEISFDTTQQWPDQASAEVFLLNLYAQFPPLNPSPAAPGSGPFLVTIIGGSGGATQKRLMRNAAIEAVNAQIMGQTTKQTYRIRGGAFSIS